MYSFVCSSALASVTSLSPYSFDRSAEVEAMMMMMMMMMVIFEVSNERLPVHCLPLLATASPSYFKSVDQVMVVMMMVVMMVMMVVMMVVVMMVTMVVVMMVATAFSNPLIRLPFLKNCMNR